MISSGHHNLQGETIYSSAWRLVANRCNDAATSASVLLGTFLTKCDKAEAAQALFNSKFDILVVGGGLAGISVGYRLARIGKRVALFDSSLPAANGQLGGFAKFSGAKFSLLPAGQGLVPLAGSVEALLAEMRAVLDFLGLAGRSSSLSSELSQDQPMFEGLSLRSYRSIVLTPEEMDELIVLATERIQAELSIIRSRVAHLVRSGGMWEARSPSETLASAPQVVFAGGRAAGSMLAAAGAKPQEGKGLDLGVRVEFLDRSAIYKLRLLGPDAKVLHNNSRTFCLNSPGTVYRYPFGEHTIPGGVVADSRHPSANVGLLVRTGPKSVVREQVVDKLDGIPRATYENSQVVTGSPFQDKMAMIESVYGRETSEELLSFAKRLQDTGMIDWKSEHRVHFPLIDWHWDTYAIGKSHRTSAPGLWVVGDCAGHARGLLQAAVSGWMAAKEMADSEKE